MECSSAFLMIFTELFLCLIKWVSDSFWIWKGWYTNVCANFWLCTLLKNWLGLVGFWLKGFLGKNTVKYVGISSELGKVSFHFGSQGCKSSARWQSDKFSLYHLTRFSRLHVEVGDFHYHFLNGEYIEISIKRINDSKHKN